MVTEEQFERAEARREDFLRLIAFHRLSCGSDAVIWGNLMYLTDGAIAEYFTLAECCESILFVNDLACYCTDPCAAAARNAVWSDEFDIPSEHLTNEELAEYWAQG